MKIVAFERIVWKNIDTMYHKKYFYLAYAFFPFTIVVHNKMMWISVFVRSFDCCTMLLGSQVFGLKVSHPLFCNFFLKHHHFWKSQVPRSLHMQRQIFFVLIFQWFWKLNRSFSLTINNHNIHNHNILNWH